MESSKVKASAYLTKIYGEDTSRKYNLRCRKAEDSLSLLVLEKNDVDKPSCSSSHENKKNPKIAQESQTSEIDPLFEDIKIRKGMEETNFILAKPLAKASTGAASKGRGRPKKSKKEVKDNLKSCEKKVNKIKNRRKKFEEHLLCTICTEFLIKPVVLNCTHTFCLFCIKEWKKKKNVCPICRSKIQTMTPVLILENLIDKTLLTPEQREQRNQIITERRNQIIAERQNQTKKAVTASCLTFTATSRLSSHGRRRDRQSLTSINQHRMPQGVRENDVQISAERRIMLPVLVGPLTISSTFPSDLRINVNVERLYG